MMRWERIPLFFLLCSSSPTSCLFLCPVLQVSKEVVWGALLCPLFSAWPSCWARRRSQILICHGSLFLLLCHCDHLQGQQWKKRWANATPILLPALSKQDDQRAHCSISVNSKPEDRHRIALIYLPQAGATLVFKWATHSQQVLPTFLYSYIFRMEQLCGLHRLWLTKQLLKVAEQQDI